MNFMLIIQLYALSSRVVSLSYMHFVPMQLNKYCMHIQISTDLSQVHLAWMITIYTCKYIRKEKHEVREKNLRYKT